MKDKKRVITIDQKGEDAAACEAYLGERGNAGSHCGQKSSSLSWQQLKVVHRAPCSAQARRDTQTCGRY